MTPYSKKVKYFFGFIFNFFVAGKKFSKNRRKPALFYFGIFFIFLFFCVKKFVERPENRFVRRFVLPNRKSPSHRAQKNVNAFFGWFPGEGGTGETGGVVVNYYIYTYHKNFAQFE